MPATAFQKYVFEYLGVFVFLDVVYTLTKKHDSGGKHHNPNVNLVLTAFGIGMALTAAILFCANVSGGHLNPAASIMAWANGSLSSELLPGYIIAQLLGALSVVYFNKYFKKDT
jgi:glycerol uptake facilitator-like aquaporin